MRSNSKGYRFMAYLRRAVNASLRTKATHYYMPDQLELYEDRIKHPAYLSMLDSRSGYFQAPLAEESCFKCSFECELGSYRLGPGYMMCATTMKHIKHKESSLVLLWAFCSAWGSRGFELGHISSYKFRCRLLAIDLASQKLHNESEWRNAMESK